MDMISQTCLEGSDEIQFFLVVMYSGEEMAGNEAFLKIDILI